MDKKERNRIACKKYRESAKGKANKKVYNKKYSEENKELKAKIHKKWYEENKEYALEYNKQWKKDNPEKCKINEQNRDHDKKKISTEKWRKDNPFKCKISGWKSQGIIHDDWKNIYDIYMDTNNCDYCKKQFKNTLERNLDHNHNITESNNIRGILCRQCNLKDVLADFPPIF